MSLDQLEKIPLSEDEINHSLGNISHKVIEYKHLGKFNSLEEVLKGLRAVIILLELNGDASQAGHWITIVDRKDHYEYFDPYGFQPAQELNMTHEAPTILGILKNTKKTVNINSMRFQKYAHDVNTCGRWCITRVRHWPLSLIKFKQFIFDNPQKMSPDQWVTYLTRGATDDRFGPLK